jgi:predicted O-methyltransferase YrrM
VTRAADVRAFVAELLWRDEVVARSDGSVHRLAPVSIGWAEAEALREVVVEERATRTIDVGLGYGVASLSMCAGLLETAGSEHVAIDPMQSARFGDVGLQLLDEAGVRDLVRFEPRPSEFVLPALLEAGELFDVAFLDGNHRFDWVFVDLVYLGRLLRPGGVVFIDDHQLAGVRKAAAFMTSNLGWSVESVSEDDPLHHWVVLRTSTAPDDRNYDAFVDF